MKVYLGYKCYSGFYDAGETIAIAFDNEAKAIAWTKEQAPTEQEWRRYKEIEVV
jgi:hypothetical protein